MPTISLVRPMPLSERASQTQPSQPSQAFDTGADKQEPRCTTCSSGYLARQNVKTAFWEGDGLIVVSGIPALVCQSCGEQYYEDDTALKLDLMRGAGFTAATAVRSMRVPVFAFAASGRDRGAEKAP